MFNSNFVTIRDIISSIIKLKLEFFKNIVTLARENSINFTAG